MNKNYVLAPNHSSESINLGDGSKPLETGVEIDVALVATIQR
jgi:hypothetical protein